ncbi:MAG: hypothetical protein INR69_15105 [Mucilaginibacter polytrichastri]|nr:hypothetical protein [Mucilaginibacter polytrichastri]
MKIEIEITQAETPLNYVPGTPEAQIQYDDLMEINASWTDYWAMLGRNPEYQGVNGKTVSGSEYRIKVIR